MKRQGQASNSSGLGRIAPCRIQIRQGATIVQSQEDDGAECQSWSNRAFKNQLARAVKAFMAADEAVRGLNDHDSEIDTKIAAAIDEHLRAIDRLCRFGIDGGFGEEHPVKEY